MNLAEFALRNAKVIVFAVAVLAVLGVRSYFTTAQSVFPTMNFSRIDVVANVGDLPADQVRSSVTLGLEQAFQGLPQVNDVRSTSGQGSSELVVDFAQGTDPRVDLQYVDQAISQARASLPQAQSIVANVINVSSEPVLSFALTSPTLSQTILRQLVQYTIVPKLYGSTGLGRLLVVGGPTEEYRVELEPAALAANGLAAQDVVKALADASAITAVGVTQRDYQRYAVIVDAGLHDVAALQGVAVATKNGGAVLLGALGKVTLGVGPLTDQASFDGHHAAILNAYALPGANVVQMAAEVKARLAAVTPRLPRDARLRNFWDQTTFIVNSQSALRDAILIGAGLAIVVIFLFLRDWRLTLVAAAVIPLAMSIALFALGVANQTLNLMSVGGLAVAVGLIIDDAIVVIENIARTMRTEPALPPGVAIERAMGQLVAPMVASTATTVVVFVPLALLTGVAGFFFRALAFTLATSLIVSLALALLVAPNVALALLRRAKPHEERRDAIAAVLDRYDGVLRWALAHRLLVAIASVATLGITVAILSALPTEFLPKTDEGKFEIAYLLPTGTSLAASDAAATGMERIVTSDPAVEAVGRFTGIDSNGYSPTTQNQGLLRATLVPLGRRSGYEAVAERLRHRLETAIPAATYDFRQILEDQINDLQGGTSAPIEVDVRGSDEPTLIALADDVTKAISNVKGVVDANNGVVYDDPSLRVDPAGARLAGLGATAGDLGDAVAALTQGTIATQIPGTRRPVPVRVGLAGDPNVLGGAGSVFVGGRATALGALAEVRAVRLASNLDAENGQLIVRVTSNFSGVPLSAVTAGIERALHGVQLPPGYTAELAGQAKTQSQSFGEFVNVIAIAIALVFSVMLAAFRSFRLPLVILTAIPLALIGVALALLVTHTPVNISSFMGLLLLVGIVVKNGILLIDVANRRRGEGASVEDALVVAGKTRLRPIVMTTLAAIGGLVPLAIGLGQGAELEKPLAIAVIGGLSTATIFTLGVIPVLYAAFVGRASATPARAQTAAHAPG